MAEIIVIKANRKADWSGDMASDGPNSSSEVRGSLLRVAAYARVSTLKDEQFQSYNAQVTYYARMIKENPKWQLAGIYADEGVTGTSISKRSGFKKMMSSALSGSIDLIITKSISRFARNTIDSLNCIRRLSAAGCEVYFEKKDFDTAVHLQSR